MNFDLFTDYFNNTAERLSLDLAGMPETIIALLLLGLGLVMAYAGFNLFRLALGMTGFVIGGWVGIVTFYMIPKLNEMGTFAQLLYAAVLGAIVAGLCFLLLYKLGMFLFGSVGALWLGMLFVPPMESETARLLTILAFGFGGGIVSFFFRKTILIITTSAIGSVMAVFGLGKFLGWQIASADFHLSKSLSGELYSTLKADGNGLFVFAILLAILASGIVIQYKTAKRLSTREADAH